MRRTTNPKKEINTEKLSRLMRQLKHSEEKEDTLSSRTLKPERTELSCSESYEDLFLKEKEKSKIFYRALQRKIEESPSSPEATYRIQELTSEVNSFKSKLEEVSIQLSNKEIECNHLNTQLTYYKKKTEKLEHENYTFQELAKKAEEKEVKYNSSKAEYIQLIEKYALRVQELESERDEILKDKNDYSKRLEIQLIQLSGQFSYFSSNINHKINSNHTQIDKINSNLSSLQQKKENSNTEIQTVSDMLNQLINEPEHSLSLKEKVKIILKSVSNYKSLNIKQSEKLKDLDTQLTYRSNELKEKSDTISELEYKFNQLAELKISDPKPKSIFHDIISIQNKCASLEEILGSTISTETISPRSIDFKIPLIELSLLCHNIDQKLEKQEESFNQINLKYEDHLSSLYH